MPRGGARVGAGRPRKQKPVPVVKSPPVFENEVTVPESAPVTVESGSTLSRLPLEYMLAVMNDESVDAARRDRLAVAAAPYLHAKKGEGGKKEEAQRKAESISGKFSQGAAPPKLVAIK